METEKSFLQKFSKIIDLLGQKPKFLIEGKEKFTTMISGILSILIYILAALACFFFGRELYLKRDPIVIVSNSFDNSPRDFNLTKEKFAFFIGIQNSESSYQIDERIFSVNFISRKFIKKTDEKGNVDYDMDLKMNKMETCNLTKHFNNFQHLFKDQELNKLYCLDNDAIKDLSLQGTWGDPVFQLFQIQVTSCKNSTEDNNTNNIQNPICASKAEIDEKLKGGFFVVNYVDSIFEPKNYTHPQKYVRRNFYTSMSNKFFKELSFYMKNIDYLTESGFILDQQTNDYFLQLDYSYEIYDFRESNEFFFCNFRLSYNRDIYYRKYIKIQDVIAQVGGFFKGIMIIAKFLDFWYSKSSFFINLLNSLYFFEDFNEKFSILDQKNKIWAAQHFRNNLPNNSEAFSSQMNKNNKLTEHERNFTTLKVQQINIENKKSFNKPSNQFSNHKNKEYCIDTDNYKINNNSSNNFINMNHTELLNCNGNKIKEAENQKEIFSNDKANKSNQIEFEKNENNKILTVKNNEESNLNANRNKNPNSINKRKNRMNSSLSALNNPNNFSIENKTQKQNLGNQEYFAEFNDEKGKVAGNKDQISKGHKENKSKITPAADIKNSFSYQNLIVFNKIQKTEPLENLAKNKNNNLKEESQENKSDKHQAISKIRKNLEDFNHHKNNLDYSFFKVLKASFSVIFNIKYKENKMILFEKMHKHFNKRFDIISYMNLYDEIETIKLILFEEEQVNCLQVLRNSKKNYDHSVDEDNYEKSLCSLYNLTVNKSNYEDLKLKNIVQKRLGMVLD